jgi:hypothetical protein
MPPLGTVRRDDRTIGFIRLWIEAIARHPLYRP